MLDLSCVFPALLFESTWYTFGTLFSLIFSIGTVYGWSIVVLKKWTVSLSFFYVGYLVLFIERYWQSYDQKNDRYNADLIGIHHFRICSWVFPFGCIEDKCLVNCSDFLSYCKSIHGMSSDFICSEDEEDFFEVIDDIFMSMEVIFFKWLSFISLAVFSNVGSGLNFATSIMLFIIICSILSPKKW